ncbi:MAG: hypothetical protein H7838_13655, partial [Magnetococcus sp. DMHC-8]
MIDPTVSPSPAKTRQRALSRVAVALILAIATILTYHHRDAFDPVQLTVWVQSWGTAGMAIPRQAINRSGWRRSPGRDSRSGRRR